MPKNKLLHLLGTAVITITAVMAAWLYICGRGGPASGEQRALYSPAGLVPGNIKQQRLGKWRQDNNVIDQNILNIYKYYDKLNDYDVLLQQRSSVAVPAGVN